LAEVLRAAGRDADADSAIDSAIALALRKGHVILAERLIGERANLGEQGERPGHLDPGVLANRVGSTPDV
jgi:hypothetical protein